MAELGWLEGYFEYRRQGAGVIRAEQSGGRKYFFASVSFPNESDWWPRSTETCSLNEAREWVDEQLADWAAHKTRSATDREAQSK